MRISPKYFQTIIAFQKINTKKENVIQMCLKHFFVRRENAISYDCGSIRPFVVFYASLTATSSSDVCTQVNNKHIFFFIAINGTQAILNSYNMILKFMIHINLLFTERD